MTIRHHDRSRTAEAIFWTVVDAAWIVVLEARITDSVSATSAGAAVFRIALISALILSAAWGLSWIMTRSYFWWWFVGKRDTKSGAVSWLLCWHWNRLMVGGLSYLWLLSEGADGDGESRSHTS